MSTVPRPGDMIAPAVRFPRMVDSQDLNAMAIVVQDLSVIYDLTAVATLPGYQRVSLPRARIGPRRRSPLRRDDRLPVGKINFGSELEIVFLIVVVTGSLGLASRAAKGVKAWMDVLSAGLDISERRRALDEARELGRERISSAELENEIRRQHVRRATAEADLVEQIRDVYLDGPQGSEEEALLERLGERGARHLEEDERLAGRERRDHIAELLGGPITRLLTLGGGQIEIEGDITPPAQPPNRGSESGPSGEAIE